MGIKLSGLRNLYTIELPDGWENCPEIAQKDSCDLAFGMASELAEKLGYMADGNVTCQVVGNKTPKECIELIIKDIKKSAQEEVIFSITIQFNNTIGYKLESKLFLENIGTLYCVQQLVVNKGIAYCISCRTMYDSKDNPQLHKKFEEILASFKLLPPQEVKGKKIFGTKKRYSLQLPDGWEESPELAKQNNNDIAFSTVPGSANYLYLADGNVTIQKIPKQGILRDCLAGVTNEIQEDLKGKILSSKEVQIGSQQGYELESQLNIPNLGLVYCFTVIVAEGGYCYLVTCRIMDGQEKKPDSRKDFQKIFGSLEVFSEEKVHEKKYDEIKERPMANKSEDFITDVITSIIIWCFVFLFAIWFLAGFNAGGIAIALIGGIIVGFVKAARKAKHGGPDVP
jgi:hypothetical protein